MTSQQSPETPPNPPGRVKKIFQPAFSDSLTYPATLPGYLYNTKHPNSKKTLKIENEKFSFCVYFTVLLRIEM